MLQQDALPLVRASKGMCSTHVDDMAICVSVSRYSVQDQVTIQGLQQVPLIDGRANIHAVLEDTRQFRESSKLEISAQFREYLLQLRADPPQLRDDPPQLRDDPPRRDGPLQLRDDSL